MYPVFPKDEPRNPLGNPRNPVQLVSPLCLLPAPSGIRGYSTHFGKYHFKNSACPLCAASSSPTLISFNPHTSLRRRVFTEISLLANNENLLKLA